MTARGPLLLVLQPTPFCNLDCRYCYLPDRGNTARMSMATLEAVLGRVADSRLVTDRLSIVWHAGEPLVVPVAWYAQASALARAILPADVQIEQNIQTNATLIDDHWCGFIREHHVRIGVSIDGPAFLHDAARRTRQDRGTHAVAMRGVRRLQAADIPTHAICVLGRASLDHPDAIYDFFVDAGIREVGFNIEERDGINRHSTLEADADVDAFARFFARIVERYQENPDRLHVREIDRVIEALLDPAYGTHAGNTQTTPFGIVSVAWNGSVSTFSPELLGTSHPGYGNFAFGDLRHQGLDRIAEDLRLRRITREIARGVARCRQECRYFSFCRGGSPGNKLAEHGRFDGTATLFCQMTQMVVVETVLRALETDLATIPGARMPA